MKRLVLLDYTLHHCVCHCHFRWFKMFAMLNYVQRERTCCTNKDLGPVTKIFWMVYKVMRKTATVVWNLFYYSSLFLDLSPPSVHSLSSLRHDSEGQTSNDMGDLGCWKLQTTGWHCLLLLFASGSLDRNRTVHRPGSALSCKRSSA